MGSTPLRRVLTGAAAAAIAAEVLIVVGGFWGEPWWLMLSAAAFIGPAAAILGAHVTAVLFAFEGSDERREQAMKLYAPSRRRAA
jgi:hypothetical protein